MNSEYSIQASGVRINKTEFCFVPSVVKQFFSLCSPWLFFQNVMQEQLKQRSEPQTKEVIKK
jgi:hypothetical protein